MLYMYNSCSMPTRMSSTRSYLLPHEQEAIAREVDHIVEQLGKQTEAGKALGVSQAAVWKASKHRSVGPDVARKVERYVGATVDELVRKHRLEPPPQVAPMNELDLAIAYLDDLIGPEIARRVRARAGERKLRPYEWGRELLLEQEALLKEMHPTEQHPPGSTSYRKRHRSG